MKRKKYSFSDLLADRVFRLLLVLVVIVSVFPFIYMLLLSFMNTLSMKLTLTRLLNADWTIDHYRSILLTSGKFPRYILNSVITSVYACSVICLVSAMAAYAFSKKEFTGRNHLFYLFLMTMMVPGQALLIPKFLITRDLGLLNTFTGLAVPMYSAFGVVLIRSFMKGLPDDLFEAADIDGCGEIRKFISIVLPLARPAIVSLTIFTFIDVWGNLMWPLVAASGTMTTITQAVANMKNAMSITDSGALMAASTIAFLPPFILYLFLQKQFVEGIALSGIKG